MSGLQRTGTSVRPAVRWFLRLRGAGSPPLTPEELQEWERFAADPAHRRELAKVKGMWEAVHTLGGPRMPTDAELDADEFDGSVSIAQWQAHQTEQKSKSKSRLLPPSKLFLLAASIAVVAFTTAFSIYRWNSREQIQAFATPRAELRELKLVDGSVVTLGARTEIHTRITATERVIVLDRGEAWFDVAQERNRPFRVYAGDGVITALGTAFNVRRDMEGKLDRVTITVGSGAVKVEPRADDWKVAKLVKGEAVTYNREGARGEVKPADIKAAAAWKEGRLEYIHQPLSAVVASVNRYSEKPIVLANETVGEFDYSGTVFEGQIEDWLRALHTAFPISVTESDDQILIASEHQ